MRQTFKHILRSLYLLQKSLFVRFAITLIRVTKPDLVIAYDSSKVKDGVGAQFHRILSLGLISFLCNLEILRPRIEDVTIHPLDPIQDATALKKYLDYWNRSLFASRNYIQSETLGSVCKVQHVQSLNTVTLLLLSLKSRVSRDRLLIYTKDAHSISDFFVDRYRDSIDFYFSEFKELLANSNSNSELIVHYRQGAGGFAIHPGQRIPRQMTIDSVINAINVGSNKAPDKVRRMRLFTDSPADSFKYKPIQSQVHLWEEMPGFDGETVSNESSEVDKVLQKEAERLGLQFSVERDLDAFQMIVDMSKANILITSRSSLSYVGGLFNRDGLVFYPHRFWHTKLKGWITYG